MRYRIRRITALRLYQATHTNRNAPLIPLLHAVCYPDRVKFTSTVTKYGCEHEKDAIKPYKEKMQGDHNEFSVIPAGFVVSTLKLMNGASLGSSTE